MSIRTRVIVAIILTNAVIILASILAGTFHSRRNIEEYIQADMLVVADIADRFISAELELLRDDARDVSAALSGIEPGDRAEALAEQARKHPKFTGMAIIARTSEIAASAGERPDSPGLMENESIRNAFFGKIAFTSTVPTDDGVAFHLAAPIPGDREHILVLTLDGMYLSNLTAEYKVWETGHIFIDDSDGTVIANIRPEWVRERRNFIELARSDSRYGEVASVIEDATAGARGIGLYSLDGVSRICAYRPISGLDEGWFLGIVAPLSESPLRGFDSGLLLIGVIAFLLNVVMAVIASGFIRKPFAEIAALKEAAEANSRAKSGFLANMSHEIRTPLNAVVGLSELAMAEEKPGSERADKLEKIHSSGMTILNIINDILDISKVEAGKFEIIPAEYEVASMINDVVSQNAVRIGSKPIRFILDIDRNLPARLVGDELRVKQIINNLLSNAFKYTEEGMVTLGLLCEREGDGVVMTLRVADTGCGIREKDIDALFIDYARMDIETNRKIGGTGLGLPITKMLAEMMGGRVSVESDYGKGSVFTAVIRQRPAGDATIGAETAENLKRFRYAYDAQRAAGRLNRIQLPLARVLVVDDNITNLDIAKGIMKPYGMRVDCVTGGQQAVDAIRAGTPEYDAIFMDHMMPEMDGVEATRRIRALGTAYAENIPVIALTANALTGNEAMFLRNGFQAFISKPIDLARLDEVIRSFVRDRKGEEGPIGEEKTAGEGSVKRENAAAEKNGEKSGRAFRDFGSGIAGLNVSSGLERFGGEKTFMRILRSYAVNTKSLVESIRTVDTGNLAAYATTIHGIKGSSRNICALPLGDRAEALERAAKSGDADFVIRNNPAVIETVETLIREIEAALLAVEKANPRPRKAAPEVGILLRLRDACDDFDFDGIESAMEEIDLYEYEADDGLAAWLRENVLKMNFASISDRLASLSREK